MNGHVKPTRRTNSLSSLLSLLASAVGAASNADPDFDEAEMDDDQPLDLDADGIAKLDTCSYGPHRYME